ncbi:PKD repeat-containing protein [Methanolobus vulcani]|uniref:PKD repeat-containing protein n=1 Tax=Methanolobus vulcani TaxID=38026 RepID=A0A7Z7AV40_9EURY|nr:PKD domain-containing protein [Methanolobus vulcani]SDF36033.1 PKD repeat-containing protein [Methanolobus vulcani]
MRRFIAIICFLLISCVALTSAAQAATTVSASSASVTYTENDDMYIDPGLTITGSEYTYTSAKVYIGDGYVYGQDYLRYSTTGSITGSFSTSTGILTLSGSGNAAAYQAAFRNVRYENINQNPNTANRKITFVLGGSTLYFEGTGHYYEYVSYTSTWATAKANADTKTMEGMQGYLATITSDEENNFLMEKIQADAWIGGSDDASEGYWRWVTGPEGTEDGGAGRLFYVGNGVTGTPYNGEYNKWNGHLLSYGGSEPNNCAPAENFAQMYSSNHGTWNDLPDTASLDGYLLEYGGMSGDASPQLSTTVTVSVTSVNDAPTTPGAFTSPTSSQIKKGGSSMTVSWGSSSDVEGDSVKYDLWLFNGTWSLIGNLLNTNSMAFTLPEDNTGSAMFRVYANDTQDNSSARDVTFTIDSLAPVIAYGTNGNSTYANSHSSMVTGTDALAGISQMAYAWTQDQNVDSVSSWNSFANAGTLTKNSVDGDWYLHIRGTDNVGNINYSVSNVFRLDNSLPITYFSENGNSTYNQSHSTIVTVIDTVSGINELDYAWILDPNVANVSAWTPFDSGDTLTIDQNDGDWYLHIKAIDNASNINYSASNVFLVDRSNPVYSWTSMPINANTGDSVLLELNVTDYSTIVSYNVTVDGDEYQMDTSSGNYSWTIDIPASNSGTLVSQIIYNCTFIDIAGNVNTTGDILMNVSILPIADFSANVTRGISPLTVNFTDNSSGLVENWNWSFGDGSNSTESNTTHTFVSGNYTVNLTVQNSNGTSSKLMNVRCADEPVYTYSPENTSAISAYGEELNFSIQSTLYSSFVWIIDGNPVNGTGATLYSNANDSSSTSYCLINTSQYINQSDFFMDIYNISVQTSNESIGRTDTRSWEWTVTGSSESGDNITMVINSTPTITINGSDKYLRFNTTNNNKTDDNGLACSITSTSFNTGNNTTGIEVRVEVLNVSAINESSIDFSSSSIYQYFDISFNNDTLVNNQSSNRSIEFRVLNEKDGGTLIVSTVYLRHWANPQWEAYTPELIGNDGTYSYFIVRNVSGYSPFAVTCNYQYSSVSTGSGIPYYLKKLLFWSDEETVAETTDEVAVSENTDIANSGSPDKFDDSPISAGSSGDTGTSYYEDIAKEQGESNTLKIVGLFALLIVAGFFILFLKRRDDEEKKQL